VNPKHEQDASPAAKETPKSFRGAIEPIKSGHNYPFTAARMTISPYEIKIRRLLGRNRRLTKDSSVSIDIDVKRSPLQWATIVTLQFVEGGKGSQLYFLPFSGKACTQELQDAGWLRK
jgi:hypothetical protein